MTQSWRVSIGFADVEVAAGGWLDALALGLPDLGIDFGALGSLAVEPLDDGGVIAHDPLTELEIRVVPIGATPVFVMPIPSFDAVDVPEPAGLVPARTAGDPFPIVATGPERPVAPPPPAAWPGRAPAASRAALPPSRRPPAAYTPEPMAAPPTRPPAAALPEDPDDAPDPWIAAVEEEPAPDLSALADTPEPMALRGAALPPEHRNPGIVPPPIGVAPWDLPADPPPAPAAVVAPAPVEAGRVAAPPPLPAPPPVAPAPTPVEATRLAGPPPAPPPVDAARPAPPPVDAARPADPPVEAARPAPPVVEARAPAPPPLPPPPMIEPARRAPSPSPEAARPAPPPVPAPSPPPAPEAAPVAEAFVEADTTVGGQVIAPRAGLSQDEVEDLFLQLGDISSANGVAAASGIALRILLGLVPAGAGAVLIRTRAGDGLRFRAASGPAASQLVDSVIPLDRGIAGFVTQLGVGLSVADARRDRRHDARVDRSTGFTTRALLAVPVKDRGAPFGCIELLNPPRPFDERDLELATRVAASLGNFLQSVYTAH
jgi:hypothetical protein